MFKKKIKSFLIKNESKPILGIPTRLLLFILRRSAGVIYEYQCVRESLQRRSKEAGGNGVEPSIWIDRNKTKAGVGASITREGEGFKLTGDSGTAFIISYTGVSNEPRVIRQAAALLSEGWRVVVFGFMGNSPNPREWLFVQLPSDNPYLPTYRRWMLASRGIFGLLSGIFPILGVGAERADFGFFHVGDVVIREGEHIASQYGCQLILCHDYFTATPAVELARRLGAPVVLDAHEYAKSQYMHNWRWRLFQRPLIMRQQENIFPLIDGMTTVSPGICELLNKDYNLRRPCITVRSIPPRCEVPYREAGEQIKVLYHGNIDYVRGLHKAVRSMVGWPENYEFIVRGYAAPDYREYLLEIAEELGVSERFHLLDPVPFDELIRAASEADIGYFVHKDISPQKRFVLPNKFFEYIQAGLALCVSDLPDMASIVKDHSLGVLVESYDEESIALAITSLNRERINSHKKSAIAARSILSWENEAQKMTRYYKEIVDKHYHTDK